MTGLFLPTLPLPGIAVLIRGVMVYYVTNL